MSKQDKGISLLFSSVVSVVVSGILSGVFLWSMKGAIALAGPASPPLRPVASAEKPKGISQAAPLCSAEPSFFDLKAKDIENKEVDLAAYRGKVLMVVNTASRCGFTRQFKELQQLQLKYAKQGFTVLGFPSNDFAGQEPGSNQQIKSFCELNYHVTFPLFSKAPVSGAGKQAVYRFLTAGRPEVAWNFEKFVIDRKGQIAGRFLSKVDPVASDVTAAVEAALAQKTESCQ